MRKPALVATTVILAMGIDAIGETRALPFGPPSPMGGAAHGLGLPRSPVGPGEGLSAQSPSIIKVHTVVQASSTLALVAAAERRFSERVESCDTDAPVGEFSGCVSDALDQFSTDLAAPRVDLPLQLREVPTHLSRAAAEVRAVPEPRRRAPPPAPVVAEPAPEAPAETPETAQPAPEARPAAPAEDAAERSAAIEQAREAVAFAVTEIRKDIILLEATEETAEIQEVQTRTGEIIAASLERLDAKLLEAVEI